MFVKGRCVGLLALCSVLALVAACGPSPTPETIAGMEEVEMAKEAEVASAGAGLPFEGVEVNLMTLSGPQILEPMERRAPDFEALTGARINFIKLPFNEIYQKFLTDVATGQNSFDAVVFAPLWSVDFILPGYLEDLTPRVEADPDIEWEDVALFFRDFSATYASKIYTIPLDGDYHMVYYRTDLLEEASLEPPETWDDYLHIAATLHGQDMNGDGTPDFGECTGKARYGPGPVILLSIAASFLQIQGTSQGIFFDTDTMEPLAKTEAFKAALEIYNETTQYGPPDALNLNLNDSRALFITGRCALAIDWGDIGTLAIDPDESTVQDKVGAVILPGSTKVLDRASGQLVACDDTTCPYAINGVNHAPFAAFGGWAGAINAGADEKVKEAAYAFLSYMCQPAQSNVDVTLGITGFNPYRRSQFLNQQMWVAAGMSPQAAANYLGAIEASLSSPNMALDLRIPQNQRYEQTVLDLILNQYAVGELSVEEAMQQIHDGWEEITEELGREEQLEAYRNSLSVKR
jgi:multiple sugar transport system substrate-binding protein